MSETSTAALSPGSRPRSCWTHPRLYLLSIRPLSVKKVTLNSRICRGSSTLQLRDVSRTALILNLKTWLWCRPLSSFTERSIRAFTSSSAARWAPGVLLLLPTLDGSLSQIKPMRWRLRSSRFFGTRAHADQEHNAGCRYSWKHGACIDSRRNSSSASVGNLDRQGKMRVQKAITITLACVARNNPESIPLVCG